MPRSANGFGTTFYGRAEKRPDGSYLTTEWLIAAYFPLFPLRSIRVRSGERHEHPDLFGFGIRQQHEVVEMVPRYWKGIGRTYGIALVGLGWYLSLFFFFEPIVRFFGYNRTLSVIGGWFLFPIIPAVWFGHRENKKFEEA